ncbi:hypothetical protein ACFE04_016689 [Oxalis oulophora]
MNQSLLNSNSNSSDHFEPLLKESIHRFFTQYKNGSTDFSNFTSIFSRLLHNLADPPLEILWFYAALNSHCSKSLSHQQNLVDRVSLLKELFQLLTSYSASSCIVSKRIALLAPVIYDFCHLLFYKKEFRSEIELLLEGIFSYISICCAEQVQVPLDHREGLRLNSSFADLVRVWLLDRNRDNNCEIGEDLRLFLPIASDNVRKLVVEEQCGVQYLAGVVTCEVFLLRLCLKFGLGVSRVELEKDLLDCAVQMMTGFQSFYFFDALIRMLLEPVLPVPPPLYFILLPGSEDDVLLREVLYDAVLTVNYSFFNPQGGALLPGNSLKNLAMTWLFVADNAIRFARENGDQAKVIWYISAFANSHLPSQLIDWVICQSGSMEKISKPMVFTPISLIKWLLLVEDEGIRIFDCHVSKIYAKAALCKSREVYELPLVKHYVNNLTENLIFANNEAIGKDKVNSEVKMVNSTDAQFISSPDFVKPFTNGTRKRKEERWDDEEEVKVKVVKYKFHGGNETLRLDYDDGLIGKIDDLVTDEAMEDMEQ